MTTKQELRDQRDRARAMVAELVAERNAALDELAAVRSERDAALAALTELRQADEPTTPTPRAFRVGDRVRVGPHPTFRTDLHVALPCFEARGGDVGVIKRFEELGDVYLWMDDCRGGYVSPEHLTLIETDPAAAEPTVPAPRTAVEVVYVDGSLARFDADMVEVSDDAPVYEMFKGGAFVACVSIMQARSIAVVTR